MKRMLKHVDMLKNQNIANICKHFCYFVYKIDSEFLLYTVDIDQVAIRVFVFVHASTLLSIMLSIKDLEICAG